MKPTFVLAALLAVTPASADCDHITKSRLYSVPAPNGEMAPYFTITNVVDAKAETICIALDPASPFVKSIQFDSKSPYCFELKEPVKDDQLMTPIVTFQDGDISILPAMTVSGARQAYDAILDECKTESLGIPDGPRTPAAYRQGFEGRIYVKPGVL
jgi:hypothetical protein